MSPTFHFFDVHAWCCLYFFVVPSREPLLILSALSYLPSSILALPNPKMSPTFHFFDAHIWSYLYVFGPLPRGLDMTQLCAPYPICIFEVESDDYHSESEEESVTLHVQGYALTFPPFSAFGARLRLAGRCDRFDSSFRTYVFFSQNGRCLLFNKYSRSSKGSNKAESASAKGQRKAWRVAFHDLYGCPPTTVQCDDDRVSEREGFAFYGQSWPDLELLSASVTTRSLLAGSTPSPL